MSELSVLTFLLLALVLSTWVLARPHKKPYAVGLLSALVMIAGFSLAGGSVWRTPDAHSIPLLLSALLLMPTWVIARGFGRVDLMAIAIHAGLGMKGGSLKGYENEIISSLVVVSVAALSVWGLYNLLETGPAILWADALTLVALNPIVRDVVSRKLRPAIVSDLSRDLLPPGPLREPPAPPDLVVVFLEGLDRRFFDTATFGELAAPIAALEAESLSFDGVRQIAGTGWSLAGMVAGLAGVPVLPRGMRGHNKLDGIDRFMPAIVTLGDLLKPKGYMSSYIVGADPRFAGIDAFYRTHGFEVIGRDDQIALHDPEAVKAARIDRVLDDQMTFDSARLRYAEMIATQAPALLVVETIGPHGRTGYLSRRASADGRGRKSQDWRAVVGSLIEETAAFIADIRALQARLRPDRPLRIVLMSDHLSHNVNLPRGAEAFQGCNTVLFLGAGRGRVVREGSMIDVFPTLLEWLGFAGPGAVGNLGRSLLSAPETLVETHGVKTLDAMLTSDARLAARLWAEAAEPRT